jgi:DNA-directed RNA polymerase subunit RPC12/RpoP
LGKLGLGVRKPFQEVRKHAPETGTAFDFVRVEVFCAQCGKKGLEPLAELVANDTVACGYCGAVIDVTTEYWRSRLAEEAEGFKKIKPASGT